MCFNVCRNSIFIAFSHLLLLSICHLNSSKILKFLLSYCLRKFEDFCFPLFITGFEALVSYISHIHLHDDFPYILVIRLFPSTSFSNQIKEKLHHLCKIVVHQYVPFIMESYSSDVRSPDATQSFNISQIAFFKPKSSGISLHFLLRFANSTAYILLTKNRLFS